MAAQADTAPTTDAPVSATNDLNAWISQAEQANALGTGNLNDPRIDPNKPPDPIQPEAQPQQTTQQPAPTPTQGTPLSESDFELPKQQETPKPTEQTQTPIAAGSGTTQLPESEAQKPLTESDFKVSEHDELAATIAQGNQDLINNLAQKPRQEIFDQYNQEKQAGHQPDDDLYAQALQKNAQKDLDDITPKGPADWAAKIGQNAAEAGKVASELATGATKGFTGLGDSLTGLKNTVQSAANEAGVAIAGVAGNPNAAVELRGMLEKNKAQMDPAEYQRQSDLILQLAGVENEIKQNDLAQFKVPVDVAHQLQNSTNQLFEQKKALIAQINPSYSAYRQTQAQRNVGSGIATGIAQGIDTLGRAGTWLAYNAPTGIALKYYDAHRDLQSWKDELADHYANAQQLNDLASGKDITLKGAIPSPFSGSPQASQPFEVNLLPGNLQEIQAHGYAPDPQKIKDVSDAFQLASTMALPLDLGIGDLIAPKILGGLGKVTETAGATAGKMLAKSAKAYGPMEIMGGIMEGIPKLATAGPGAFAAHVAQAIGTPIATYATGKVAQAATKVAGDFFAKAASDSWKTSGFLPNMARRLTAEAINAPLESVGYGAITSDNPEQFAQNVTTMAALRAGLALPKEGLGALKNTWVDRYFGGAKNGPTPYQDYAPSASMDPGELKDLNSTSKEAISSLPADQQNAVNATRQFVGPEAQIHVVPTDEWDAVQKKYAPNSQGVSSRGFYLNEPQGADLYAKPPKMIFIRADAVPDALGWETGRLLHSLMPEDVQQRFNAAAASGMHGGMDAFTQNYIRDLIGRGQGDLSQYPRFQDLPTEADVANGAHPGPAGLTREMMLQAAGADTARRILNGQSISQLLKDPTAMRNMRQGLAWMIDKMGFPLSSDVNPDTFDGISPGIPGSIIMEQWMRQFGRRLSTYPLPEPEIGTGAASPSGRPPSSGPVGGRATPGPQPRPPMPAAGTPQGRTFTPSTEWQPHPGPNVVLPGGGGFQHRTVGGELQVRWNNPPNVQVQVSGAPAEQEQRGKVTESPAPKEGLPAVEPEKAPAPKTLDRPAVFDRIMRSEGRGSTESMEQGQHELYGFRDRDDPAAFREIAEARARYGVGSPEEREVVHKWLEKEYQDASGDKFTNPAVQALVASMAHMRGAGGARAMIQALSDGTIRKSFGDLPQSSIDAINKMSPEEAIAKLSNVRERYDRLIYGDTPTQGGSWWQVFGNGLRNRYAREANEALRISGGSPEVYRVHSELARAQTYGLARGEGFEGPGGTRNPATGIATTGEANELGRLLMDPQTLREEASKGNQLARHLLEEQHGPNWSNQLSPEQQANYAALEGEDYADQQRHLTAEGAYPQRRSATQVLGEQAQVLRQIQDAGGFSTAAKTWVEPNAEDIAEAHAAFARLPPDYRQYLRQNFGITQQKLFNTSGTPLEDIPGRLGNGSLRTGQDIMDHYYATLSNLDRMHQGLPALEYGQTPEVSQNVPHGTGTRNVPPLTAEQVQATLRSAAESVPTTTAGGRTRDTSSKAYQNEVEAAKNEALLQAHQAALGPGDDRVQLYRDPDTGQVSASGNKIVPGDLAHDLLTEGIDPAEIALANRFGDMARNREPVTMTYRSAARGPSEAASTERQVREAEQGASPAAQRAEGGAPSEDLTKSWVPSRISIAGLGKPGKKSIILHGLSTDKIAQNIAHIQEALPASHLAKDLSKKDWAEAVSRYVENHQHGYSGDGSKALKGTDKVPVQVDSHYHTKPLPAEVAQVINMAMGDPGARGTTEKAASAREFAQRNEGYLSPEGEVNPLREEIDRTSQAYQTAQPLWHDKLTSPWETLRADLVQDVHSGHEEGPGRMREGSEGLDQAIQQYGMPRGQFVRAGFMPESRAAFKAGKEPPTQEDLEKRVGARLKAWNRQKDTVPMEVQRNEDGTIKTDKEGEPLYKQQDYGLQSAPEIKKLLKQKNGYEKATDFLASRLVKYATDWINDPRLKDAIGWYSGMTNTLQHSLGANMDIMGNLLAATSPGTGVVQNFLYSLHALKLFGRGDYDALMSRFKDHIQNAQDQAANAVNEKGNPLTDIQKQNLYRKLVRQFPEVPLREEGLKYGYNSPKVLHALAGVWEQLTEGPKISDFGRDLLGKADQAVIDRWAGRTARRGLYEGFVKRWRTNDAQESGVGKDYQFAQDAFHKAAAQMGMSNSDLQALLWYGEKQHYADRGWTSGAGKELGDFRRLSDELSNTDRYQLGLTNFTTPENWSPEAHQRMIEEVSRTIRSTPGLLASRVMPGRGIFAGEGEPSLDVEFTVPKGTDISHIHQMVADMARQHNQHSAFVTRVHDEPGLEQSRPTLEVGFKNPISSEEANTLSGRLTDAGLGGMSLALDPYRNIVGFRTQSIPEFAGINPEEHEQAHEDWANNALKFEKELRNAGNTAYAYHRKADTTIYSRDNGYKASGPGPRTRAAFMPDEYRDADAGPLTKDSERFGRWMPSEVRPQPTLSNEDRMFRARAIARSELTPIFNRLGQSPTEEDIAEHAGNILNRYSGMGQEPPRVHWSKAVAETRASGRYEGMPPLPQEPEIPSGWSFTDTPGTTHPGPDVIPPISPERRAQLNQLWQDVSKQDEAFKFGIPKNGTPEAVAANYSTRSNPLKMNYRGVRGDPSSVHIENKRTGGYIDIKGLHGSSPFIDATEAESSGGKEGGGSQMYQAAFSWAAMNGKTLHGGSLTDINAMRRTSNMLSSALRHETTEQFTPGNSQDVDWVEPGEGYNIDTTGNPTDWHTPETAYEHNVAELARAESNTAHRRIPELGTIHYDFDKNVFLSDSNKPMEDSDIEDIIKKSDPRFSKGVGLATAKRAIITASALENGVKEQGKPVFPAIQSPRGPGSPFARILYKPETGAPVPREQAGKLPTFVPLSHRKED